MSRRLRMDKCKAVLSALYPDPSDCSPGAFWQGVRRVVLASSVMSAAVSGPAHALTQEELVAKLEAAGYSQIRDVKSTAEGISVKATKDGKDVSLVVDSSGKVKERH